MAVKVFNVKVFNEWMDKGELKKDKAAKRMKGLLRGRGLNHCQEEMARINPRIPRTAHCTASLSPSPGKIPTAVWSVYDIS